MCDAGATGYFPSDYLEQMIPQQPMMANAPHQQIQRATNMGGPHQQIPGQMSNIHNQVPQSQQPFSPMMPNVLAQLTQGQQHQQQRQQQQQQQIPSQLSAASSQQMQRLSTPMSNSTVTRARALFNFPGDGPNQMKLTAGETIEIISRGAPGGWCTGVRGAFPTDYVEFLNLVSSNQAVYPTILPSSTLATNGSSFGNHPESNSLGLNSSGDRTQSPILGSLDSAFGLGPGVGLVLSQETNDKNMNRANSNVESGKIRFQVPSRITSSHNSDLLDMSSSESNAPSDLLDLNGGHGFGFNSTSTSGSGSGSFSGPLSGSSSGSGSMSGSGINISKFKHPDSANSSLKEFDMYNGIAMPSVTAAKSMSTGTGIGIGGTMSLLDLDDSIQHLQPQKIDTLRPANLATSGMQDNRPGNNIDILDSLLISIDAGAINKLPQSSMNSSFTNFNSSVSASNKVTSSFSSMDGLDSSSVDIFDMSSIPVSTSKSTVPSDLFSMSTTIGASDMIGHNTSSATVASSITSMNKINSSGSNNDNNNSSSNDDNDNSNNTMKGNNVKPPPVAARVVPPSIFARAIYTREAEGSTELSLESGDFILVETKESEWWYGSIVHVNGNKNKADAGFFPGNYVEVVEREVVTAHLATIEQNSVNTLTTPFNPMRSNNSNNGQGIRGSFGANSIVKSATAMSSTLLLPDSRDPTRHTTIAKFSSTFVCSTGIGENIPIWKHPIFSDLFVDYYTPHPSPISPSLPGDPRAARVDNNKTIKKMCKSLKLVTLALQRAREFFIVPRNKINSDEDLRNDQLSQVLLHNIGIFNDALKLCEKLPANSGN